VVSVRSSGALSLKTVVDLQELIYIVPKSIFTYLILFISFTVFSINVELYLHISACSGNLLCSD